MPYFERQLAGWGRFPVQMCRVARPEKRRDLLAAAGDFSVPDLIARGLGRAYGDAALNEHSGVLNTEKLGRFLSFDPKTAVLHAESGASLADILETFVPRGYFLPVVPGTKFVTIGGAIACDVHGKNHHRDGCLSEFVEEFELLLASGDLISCSRQENSEAFWATLGGLGLTGIIVSAKVRLMPIETAFIRSNTIRTRDLDETLAQFDQSDRFHYSVAWIDGLSSGASLGRSVLLCGDHARAGDVDGEPLSYGSGGRKKNVPRDFPDFALSPLSVKAFNAFYYANHPDREQIVPFEPFFWPLDAVSGWNRIYGARGFVQYQCVLPFETARDGLKNLLETISSSGHAAFLGVLKKFGAQNAAPLSFPLPGYSLALDLPASADITAFAQRLDAIVLNHGGRVYLAKDATCTPESVRAMYGRLGEFESVKNRLDPQNRFASSLSKRLEIGCAQSGDSQSGDSQSGDSQSGDSQSGDSQSGDSQSGVSA